MTPRYPYLQAAIFFAVAFILAVLFEILLLLILGEITGRRISPRGLGWIVIPFLAGAGGWMFGLRAGYESILRKLGMNVDVSDPRMRLWIAASALWVLSVVIVFLVFDPFDSYRWYASEWTKFLTILLGPPLMALFGIYLFGWAQKNGK